MSQKTSFSEKLVSHFKLLSALLENRCIKTLHAVFAAPYLFLYAMYFGLLKYLTQFCTFCCLMFFYFLLSIEVNNILWNANNMKHVRIKSISLFNKSILLFLTNLDIETDILCTVHKRKYCIVVSYCRHTFSIEGFIPNSIQQALCTASLACFWIIN